MATCGTVIEMRDPDDLVCEKPAEVEVSFEYQIDGKWSGHEHSIRRVCRECAGRLRLSPPAVDVPSKSRVRVTVSGSRMTMTVLASEPA